MYLSMRVAFVRNIAASAINSLVTLVLLLIAPLGLAAVIVNTVLVGISTFLVCSACDIVVGWLSHANPPERLLTKDRQGKIVSRSQKPQNIEQRRPDWEE